jgi:hypothetical protein
MIQKKKKGPRYKEQANQKTLHTSQGYSTKPNRGRKRNSFHQTVESLQIQRGQAPNPHNRKVPDIKRKQKLEKSHDSTTLKSTKSSKRKLKTDEKTRRNLETKTEGKKPRKQVTLQLSNETTMNSTNPIPTLVSKA